MSVQLGLITHRQGTFGALASCKVALPPNLLQDSHTPSANHQVVTQGVM
jgi:hypothetical protein